jgi:TonB family protein
MRSIPDLLEQLGSATLETLWLPVLFWSALALLAVLALNLWRSGHPWIKYQSYMALLLALPLGLCLAWTTEISLPVRPVTYAPVAPTFLLPEDVLLEPVAAEPAGFTFEWTHVLGVFTLLGMALMFSQSVLVYRRWSTLRRLKKTLKPVDDPDLRRHAAALAGQMGIRRPVRLCTTDEPLVPLTYGTLNPAIVLPGHLIHDQPALGMALRHELVHVRRYDNALQWMEQALGAVFFLHPFVALLRRRIGHYREVTCDLEVLSEGTVQPKAYAQLLYGFLTPPPHRSALGLGMAGSPKQLARRLTAMKMNRFPISMQTRRTGLVLAGVLLCAASVIVACSDIVGPEAPESLAQMATADITAKIEAAASDSSASDSSASEPEMLRQIDVARADTDTVVNVNQIFTIVDQAPQFSGGREALQSYLASTLEYPEIARRAGIQGMVVVQFVVNEQGQILDPVVLRNLGAGLDEEALRAVRNMPRWEPGVHKGVPVKVRFTLPIPFKLPEGTPATSPESQTSPQDGEVFTIVDQPPRFPGGFAAHQAYLAANLRYPEIARRAAVSGVVFVQFIVNEEGQILNPVVTRGVGAGLDEEALRLVSNMPRWTPAIRDGVPVKVHYATAIVFPPDGVSFPIPQSSADGPVLYVLDGVEVGHENPLKTIRLENIENITVRKDASAIEQYGADGAGGVIIITTK